MLGMLTCCAQTIQSSKRGLIYDMSIICRPTWVAFHTNLVGHISCFCSKWLLLVDTCLWWFTICLFPAVLSLTTCILVTDDKDAWFHLII
jgi:hypothetical protein